MVYRNTFGICSFYINPGFTHDQLRILDKNTKKLFVGVCELITPGKEKDLQPLNFLTHLARFGCPFGVDRAVLANSGPLPPVASRYSLLSRAGTPPCTAPVPSLMEEGTLQ